MSESDNSRDEDVSIPEAEHVAGTPGAPRKSGMPLLLKGVLFAVGGVVVVGGFVLIASPDQVGQGGSEIASGGNIDATPGGQVERDNQIYQESIRQVNERRAEAASERGITSMPTPEPMREEETSSSDITPIETPEPEEEETASAPPEEESRPELARNVEERRILPRPPRTSTQSREQETRQAPVRTASAQTGEEEPENPYIAAMSTVMSDIAASETPSGLDVQSYENTPAPVTSSAAGSGTTDDSMPASPGNGADTSPFLPGDVLYAEMMTTLSSDMDTPVLAEVVTGEYAGSRLVGSFDTPAMGTRMVVSFDTMTTPDGEVVDLNAYAIDGDTAQAAVRSDINRRYLQRYGPVLASTFVSSYAGAIGQTRTRVVGNGDLTTIVRDQATSDEALASGLAAATGSIADDISSSGVRGPEVLLESGTPIGVLVVDSSSQASGQEAPTRRSSPGRTPPVLE